MAKARIDLGELVMAGGYPIDHAYLVDTSQHTRCWTDVRVGSATISSDGLHLDE
jgi:hypothetical protein